MKVRKWQRRMIRLRTVGEIKANEEANRHEHLRHMMEMEEEARKNEAATSFTSVPDASKPMSAVEEYVQCFMEELSREREAERKERNRKRDAEHQEHLKYMERMDRKHQEHLKKMDEIENGPPIPYPIIVCPIPSPPVQEVTLMKAAPMLKTVEVS